MHTAVVWRPMVVIMIARMEGGIVTEVAAATLPLPSGLRTALCIIPIAPLPEQQALHEFIEARRDMEDIWTGMVTGRHVNRTGALLPQAMMFDGAETI